MRTLALDIGTRRTGVALLDDAAGVPVALDTLRHRTEEELITAVRAIVAEREIDRLVIGLPLLPSGAEGAQAAFVRGVAERLRSEVGIPCSFLDERYTTSAAHQPSDTDPDAASAVAILQSFPGVDITKN